MGLHFENLDSEIRPLMLSEVRQDLEAGTIYLSNHLTDEGGVRWPDLLMQAVREGNDDSLAAAAAWSFRAETPRRKPKGGFTMARVPVTASQTLAESQFNMYYMRALALRSIETGQRLQVYRAKAVDVPRASSEAMIGDYLDAATVLEALRKTKGVEPAIGIPMPNSGITIRLIP